MWCWCLTQPGGSHHCCHCTGTQLSTALPGPRVSVCVRACLCACVRVFFLSFFFLLHSPPCSALFLHPSIHPTTACRIWASTLCPWSTQTSEMSSGAVVRVQDGTRRQHQPPCQSFSRSSTAQMGHLAQQAAAAAAAVGVVLKVIAKQTCPPTLNEALRSTTGFTPTPVPLPPLHGKDSTPCRHARAATSILPVSGLWTSSSLLMGLAALALTISSARLR